MNKPKPPQPPKHGRRQIKLEVPASLMATYTNFAMITHTASEVIFDFAQIMPNMPKARVQTRVVLTPTNARLLLNALNENLANYEKKFGEIKTPPTLADYLFSTIVKSGETPADAAEDGDSGDDDDDQTPDSDETETAE